MYTIFQILDYTGTTQGHTPCVGGGPAYDFSCLCIGTGLDRGKKYVTLLCVRLDIETAVRGKASSKVRMVKDMSNLCL